MAVAYSEEEFEAFRDTLVNAAIKIVAEDGMDALTLRCLANEVGCSRQTPYGYFRNKDELIEEAFVKCHQVFIDYCEKAVDGVTDPREKLRNIRDVAPRFHREQEDIYKVMSQRNMTQSMPRVDELAAYEMMRLNSFFEEALEEGFVEGDPITLGVMFTNAIDTLARAESQELGKAGIDTQKIADFIEQTFFPPKK
jgi:AcrR family transcriptional regulator